MGELSFGGFAVVAAVAFGAPLVVGLVPRLRLPAVVLEIVAGIVLGPSVLGWLRPDPVLEVLSAIGLAFLLFLAGAELEPSRFKGALLRASLSGFVVSFGLALAVGFGLQAIGVVDSALFIAIVLTATSLGLVIPVLRDARQSSTELGQLTIAGSSLADVGAVILLSLFFSREATATPTKLLLLGAFVLLVVIIGLAVAEAGHWRRLSQALVRLQDSTAEIRVRGAVTLMAVLLVGGAKLGLEVLLAAFVAGALLKMLDRHASETHPHFALKLQAVGFGFVVPVFFVVSGVGLDVRGLVESPENLARIPVFLAALVVVRGVPALLYRNLVGLRHAVAAGLLQATSLPFLVASSEIGMALGVIDRATGTALIAAGLLSVLVFPASALTLLAGSAKDSRDGDDGEGGRETARARRRLEPAVTPPPGPGNSLGTATGRAAMTAKKRDLKRGDRVEWNAHGGKKKPSGKAVGRVVKRVTKETKVKGHTAKASPENPQYVVESEQSGTRAVHRAGALRKKK